MSQTRKFTPLLFPLSVTNSVHIPTADEDEAGRIVEDTIREIMENDPKFLRVETDYIVCAGERRKRGKWSLYRLHRQDYLPYLDPQRVFMEFHDVYRGYTTIKAVPDMFSVSVYYDHHEQTHHAEIHCPQHEKYLVQNETPPYFYEFDYLIDEETFLRESRNKNLQYNMYQNLLKDFRKIVATY